MAFTGSDEDKTSIRERLDTYGDAVARQDLESYLACWTGDGRRTGAGGECQGTAGLRAHWGGVFGSIEQMAFFTQIAAIEIHGDRATVRSSCLEVLKFRDGNSTQLVGEYADDLVRVAGDWLFAHRHYEVAMTF
jgi:ketosteroid isomerase-like protein